MCGENCVLLALTRARVIVKNLKNRPIFVLWHGWFLQTWSQIVNQMMCILLIFMCMHSSKFRNMTFYVTKTISQEQPYCCNGYVGIAPACTGTCVAFVYRPLYRLLSMYAHTVPLKRNLTHARGWRVEKLRVSSH